MFKLVSSTVAKLRDFAETVIPMRAVRQILAGESALAEWLARRRHELGLEERVRRALPTPLASSVAVGDGRPPELVLLAGSGAAAAMLRQRAPEVLETLRRAGWQFTGIRVRVQARSAAAEPKKFHPKHLDNASAAKLATLAERIDDPALKAALTRLAGRIRPSPLSGDNQPLEGVNDKDREQ